jgi:hypothetical protein
MAWLPVNTTHPYATVRRTQDGAELVLPAAGQDQQIQPPQAGDLDSWQQHIYELDLETAGKLGFGIGSVQSDKRRRVLVLEFSRSKDLMPPGAKQPHRYGTAVRLVVQVSKYDLDANLALPAVAAQAQLGHLQASSELIVLGYVGSDLAQLIPSFSTLDVETYAELMKSVTAIQQKIGGDSDNIRPVPLAVLDQDGHDASTSAFAHAVAVTWALSQIAEAKPLNEARAHFPAIDVAPPVHDIEHTYRQMAGSELPDDAEPPAAAREKARGILGRLRLGSHGMFG